MTTSFAPVLPRQSFLTGIQSVMRARLGIQGWIARSTKSRTEQARQVQLVYRELVQNGDRLLKALELEAQLAADLRAESDASEEELKQWAECRRLVERATGQYLLTVAIWRAKMQTDHP